MATYGELLPGNYYIVQEQENAMLELVYVPLVTDKCILVEYQNEDQTLSWYKKSETISEVVEQLTEEQAVIYESLFEEDDEEDEFWDAFDDDDDDDFWEEGEEETEKK